MSPKTITEGAATASTKERLLDRTGHQEIPKKLFCCRKSDSAVAAYSLTETAHDQSAWHHQVAPIHNGEA